MSVFVSSQEARNFVSFKHTWGYEVPRDVSFDKVGNHFAAAVLFAAMNELPEMHDLRHLFVAFHTHSPSNIEKGLSRAGRAEKARRQFDAASEAARNRVEDDRSPNIISAIQAELANEWKLDQRPVAVYAANQDGEVARVTTLGGFYETNNLASIQAGIAREFE